MEKKKDPANCTQNLLENFCSDLPVGIGIKRIKKMQTTTILRANQGVPQQVQIN